MNTPHYAAAAAKLLNKRVTSTQAIPDEQARGIETIERAMQARLRRRRMQGAVAVLAAAAGLVLAVQTVRQFSPAAAAGTLVAIDVSPAGRGAALRAGDRAEPLAERAQLGAGQHIETPPDGGASLKLSTGTAMDLAGSTSFRVDSQGALERFSLQRGELSAHVAKLTTGQRFIVATPDAEVEVRGTRFRLNVLDHGETCGNGTRTRLTVTEGLVEVRSSDRSTMVRAGEQWPSDCAPAGKGEAEQAEPASELRRQSPEPKSRGSMPGDATAQASGTAAERSSTLAQQNDLFQEGVALRRLGDVSGALRAYQELVTRFPRSPLVENAMVERMRLLAKSHDARARSEAERYLRRYPRGFAAKEAQALTAEP